MEFFQHKTHKSVGVAVVFEILDKLILDKMPKVDKILDKIFR